MCNSSYLISNSSLISGKSRPTTCQGLPLYPPPPAERWTLHTSLKIVRGINVEVTGEHKTIVSLNLQLHFKCMQCRSREVRKNFVFQLGELHIAFSIPKVMEKIHRREWPWSTWSRDLHWTNFTADNWWEIQPLFSNVSYVLFRYRQNPEYREAVDHLKRMLDLEATGYMKENTDHLQGILDK